MTPVTVTYSAESPAEQLLGALEILARADRVMDGAYVVLSSAESVALRGRLELALKRLGREQPPRRERPPRRGGR